MNGQYIQFEGRLYNEEEIRKRLLNKRFTKNTNIEEVLYTAYETFGPRMVQLLKGEFALAVFDRNKETIFLFRDRLGVETLYYTVVNGILVYSTNLAKILSYPGVKGVLDREGACELFGMGPARTPGKTPLKGIYELLPGSFLAYNERGCQVTTYWELMTREQEEKEEDTIEKGRELLKSALQNAEPEEEVGVLLSGGLDSSYLAQLHKNNVGKVFSYSLDFPDSQKYFKSNSFQPELDRPYVDLMVKHLDASHTYVVCKMEEQVGRLLSGMKAHCLPCMADIQSTFDYFCQEVSKEHSYVLTGECADEIFGGYPWFHKPEFVFYEGFPWAYDLSPRVLLLQDSVKEHLNLDAYYKQCYLDACKKVQYLDGEDEEERCLRRNTYLTVYYFMQTLIRRTGIASRQAGIKAIVPFSDPELVEYAYNISWKLKRKNKERKYVLRQMASDCLPKEIYQRPKSPYPKDYNPVYRQMITMNWSEALKTSCPVFELVDKEKFLEFARNGKEFDNPWFGQLMKGTQMLAYLWQVNEWLKEYNIDISLE